MNRSPARRRIVVLLLAGAAVALTSGAVTATARLASARRVVVAPSQGFSPVTKSVAKVAKDDLPPKVGLLPDFAGSWPFTIDLPQGWNGEETPEHLYDAARSWRFADNAGNFLIVNIDPEGSDFDADAVWRVRVADDRLTVAVRGPRCTREEGLCSAGDDRLDLWALWEEDGSAPMRGHVYYFHFGNLSDENADEAVFERILEGIRAR